MSSRALELPDQHRTVAVYLKGATDFRVLVDQLAGTEAEAMDTALGIVLGLGKHKASDLLCRVITTNDITVI